MPHVARVINGKKVMDAKRRLTIKITTQDVAKGATKKPDACAAARAAKRMIPNCISARVHLGRVYIEKPDHWVRYQTSEALRSEIFAFDRGGKFLPGAYVIQPPSFSQTKAGKLAAAQNRNKTYTNSDVSNRQKVPRQLQVAKGVRTRMSGFANPK